MGDYTKEAIIGVLFILALFALSKCQYNKAEKPCMEKGGELIEQRDATFICVKKGSRL